MPRPRLCVVGTWLGHDPPDNGGHERIAAASSTLRLTSVNAQDQQCYRSLRYFHTAEATGSKPVTPTSTNGLVNPLPELSCQQIASKPPAVGAKTL
jgi:hypothetical protein